MTTSTTVSRRLFSYDIAIRTNRTVQQNSDLLEKYLTSQQRPRGLVLQDPRVDGSVFGVTFTLRRHDAISWAITPQVEGVFVPTARGSDVIMSVSWPPSAKWWLLCQVGVLFVILLAAGLSLHTLTGLAILAFFAASVAVAKTVFHAEHAVRIVTRIFR